MKRLSASLARDFLRLWNQFREANRFSTAEDAGQLFVDIIYDYFRESLVLLRLFITVGYGELPVADRIFTDIKVQEIEGSPSIDTRTPVLTLLATRGIHSEWNERGKSQMFRCIPLVSSRYVASLPMLSMQFERMGFHLDLIDNWEEAVVAKGRADLYSGMLFIRDASCDRDERGRMIVPAREFVAKNRIGTVLGFGSGCPNSPALLMLFAFTNEVFDQTDAASLCFMKEMLKSVSGELVAGKSLFRNVKQES
jgi:hypothetical protein